MCKGNEKIIDKIKKLLALSDSPNEHEAKSALMKAQELLAKHKLTLTDVEDSVKEEVQEVDMTVEFKRAKWKRYLSAVISDNYGCYSYSVDRRYSSCSIIFVGKESDVNVCSMVYEYALRFVEREIKRIQRQLKADGYSTKGVANDYALGFCIGLNNQFKEQRDRHAEWGLVLMKDRDVTEYYDNLGLSRPKTTKPKIHNYALKDSDTSFYEQGVSAGESFKVNAVGQNSTEVHLLT